MTYIRKAPCVWLSTILGRSVGFARIHLHHAGALKAVEAVGPTVLSFKTRLCKHFTS